MSGAVGSRSGLDCRAKVLARLSDGLKILVDGVLGIKENIVGEGEGASQNFICLLLGGGNDL